MSDSLKHLRFGEWAPTGFDAKGAFLRDQHHWLVVPVLRTRDSGVLDQSNFEVALEQLGGQSEHVQVHRFGHWGPGWFEIILVDPSNVELEAKVLEIEASLENYSILSEHDYSEREHKHVCDTWERMRLRDRARLCQRYGVSVFAARRDEVPDSSCMYDDLRAA